MPVRVWIVAAMCNSTRQRRRLACPTATLPAAAAICAASPQMAMEGWLLSLAAWCPTSSHACRRSVAWSLAWHGIECYASRHGKPRRGMAWHDMACAPAWHVHGMACAPAWHVHGMACAPAWQGLPCMACAAASLPTPTPGEQVAGSGMAQRRTSRRKASSAG